MSALPRTYKVKATQSFYASFDAIPFFHKGQVTDGIRQKLLKELLDARGISDSNGILELDGLNYSVRLASVLKDLNWTIEPVHLPADKGKTRR